MARGQLIAESLRPGASLRVRDLGIRLLGVTSVQPPADRLAPDQPGTWTFIGFEVDDADAPRLAAALEDVLAETGAWYGNLATAEEMWVVFAGTTFHYPLGDRAGRTAARDHARRLGVPEPQLDWD